jgi:hypothetical protein
MNLAHHPPAPSRSSKTPHSGGPRRGASQALHPQRSRRGVIKNEALLRLNSRPWILARSRISEENRYQEIYSGPSSKELNAKGKRRSDRPLAALHRKAGVVSVHYRCSSQDRRHNFSDARLRAALGCVWRAAFAFAVGWRLLGHGCCDPPAQVGRVRGVGGGREGVHARNLGRHGSGHLLRCPPPPPPPHPPWEREGSNWGKYAWGANSTHTHRYTHTRECAWRKRRINRAKYWIREKLFVLFRKLSRNLGAEK